MRVRVVNGEHNLVKAKPKDLLVCPASKFQISMMAFVLLLMKVAQLSFLSRFPISISFSFYYKENIVTST